MRTWEDNKREYKERRGHNRSVLQKSAATSSTSANKYNLIVCNQTK